MTVVRLDYETFSEVDLKVHGLDRYSADLSTRVLMAGYQIDKGRVELAENGGDPLVLPAELRDALSDPRVIKKAFNAPFEIWMTRRVAKIVTPFEGWRCTMVRGFMAAFSGGLAEMGSQMGLPADKVKQGRGRQLISIFCKPQRTTKNQPHVVRNAHTDPTAWAEFCEYCRQDVVAEAAVEAFVDHLPVRSVEWDNYVLDQRINERGMPLDMQFAKAALEAYERLQAKLWSRMQEVGGLDNPNSPTQVKTWLKTQGYWFDDLRDATIEKVLRENAWRLELTEEGEQMLRMRQEASYSSIKKYGKMQATAGLTEDDEAPRPVLRNTFQFGGASRTFRDAGRGVQTQNLVRPPKHLSDPWQVEACVNAILAADDDMLLLLAGDATEAIAGLLRSAFAAPDGQEFRICDLSSIETVIIAWISNCRRLLKVFKDGQDPYKDFATELFKVAYDAVTRFMRQQAKPAVLGAGFRLGGGELRDGKRTGMWGYAEGLGVDIPRDEAHRMVRLWRKLYPEVVEQWKKFEIAAKEAMESRGRHVRCGPVTFIREGDYMRVRLPSGRHLFYFKPRMEPRTVRTGRMVDVLVNGVKQQQEETFQTIAFTYMGTNQSTGRWERLEQHGGRWMENAVQAIARDVLWEGIQRAEADGFNIVGRVHDEIITLAPINDSLYSVARLRELMIAPMPWAPDILLNAAGFATKRYTKD